jgi:hypothetical protein
MRIGDAARLLADHLAHRLSTNHDAHLAVARERLMDAAKTGMFPIVAGTQIWSVASSFPLPAECVFGLNAGNIDWDAGIFDASANTPLAATRAVQQLHAAPAILWVPKALFMESFGIEEEKTGV